MTLVPARDKIIVALDVPGAGVALRLAEELHGHVGMFKVGSEIFTGEGPMLPRHLLAAGERVFLDLKFHDIPNTVGAAVHSAAELRVSMLTVHASGGSKMLKAAAEASAGSSSKPLILAVTVLTSLSDEDLQELGLPVGVADQVLRLAGIAHNAGVRGIVTSAHEARSLRRSLGEGFPIVTPGIRPSGSAAADQARIVTPAEAIRSGASHIVVGRPVTADQHPAAAANRILAEMAEVTLAAK